jgi:hypothetical protein
LDAVAGVAAAALARVLRRQSEFKRPDSAASTRMQQPLAIVGARQPAFHLAGSRLEDDRIVQCMVAARRHRAGGGKDAGQQSPGARMREPAHRSHP